MATAAFWFYDVDVRTVEKFTGPGRVKMGQGKNAEKMAAGYLMPVPSSLDLGPTN